VGVLALLLLMLPGPADAQLQLTPHPESRFWIQGKASSINFTCTIDRVEGSAQVPTAKDSIPTSAGDRKADVSIRVPIRAVDCGNSRMTEDLQEALKMEDHPDIRFELVHATMGARTDTSAQWRRLDALGPLTVAGTKRLTRLHAAARALDDEHFRLQGCLPIRMTYFGIDPPTKAFGLIRVKNRVEVQFDLLARTTSADQSSTFDTLSHKSPPSCNE
jgi:hypothetical protein